MKLRKSQRKRAKIKMALQAPSGAGKTMSAILIAKGICNGDLSRVAIIDTENGSADLYAHLGNFNVVSLEPPFTTEKYIQAISLCEQEGMQVVIIDSISHCWDYLLDYHSSLAGNSFTNWAKIKPMEKAFVDKMLQSPCHILATMRTKQDYILNQKDGKFIPEKVGLKAVQRDGMDYEFTLVLDIDIKHYCVASKDRTGLFMDQPAFKITEETGRKILAWCNEEFETPSLRPLGLQDLSALKKEIEKQGTISGLLSLYKQHPEHQQDLRSEYEERKRVILSNCKPKTYGPHGYN